MGELASALDALHRQPRPIAHGALSPAKVRFRPRDGAAKLLGVQSPDRGPDAPLAYRSPETHDGAPPTPASDVFGLATLAFEILTGRAAFPEGPPRTTPEAWPSAHTIRAEVAEGVDAVLARAWALDPTARPASATEFVTALTAAMGLPPAAPTPAPEELTTREVTVPVRTAGRSYPPPGTRPSVPPPPDPRPRTRRGPARRRLRPDPAKSSRRPIVPTRTCRRYNTRPRPAPLPQPTHPPRQRPRHHDATGPRQRPQSSAPTRVRRGQRAAPEGPLPDPASPQRPKHPRLGTGAASHRGLGPCDVSGSTARVSQRRATRVAPSADAGVAAAAVAACMAPYAGRARRDADVRGRGGRGAGPRCRARCATGVAHGGYRLSAGRRLPALSGVPANPCALRVRGGTRSAGRPPARFRTTSADHTARGASRRAITITDRSP